jgi:hypothetical protein
MITPELFEYHSRETVVNLIMLKNMVNVDKFPVKINHTNFVTAEVSLKGNGAG